MLFRASSPKDRILGASIEAYLSALGLSRRRGAQVLADEGIPSVESGKWYPWQAYLNAQRYIYEKVGPHTVGRIGRKLVEGASFPADIDGIHAALSTLDRDYHQRHRGQDVGSFRYERTGERSGRMTIRNPYPCELDRNVIEALCQRFRPADAPVVHVRHQEGCRNQGASECVIQVHW